MTGDIIHSNGIQCGLQVVDPYLKSKFGFFLLEWVQLIACGVNLPMVACIELAMLAEKSHSCHLIWYDISYIYTFDIAPFSRFLLKGALTVGQHKLQHKLKKNNKKNTTVTTDYTKWARALCLSECKAFDKIAQPGKAICTWCQQGIKYIYNYKCTYMQVLHVKHIKSENLQLFCLLHTIKLQFKKFLPGIRKWHNLVVKFTKIFGKREEIPLSRTLSLNPAPCGACCQWAHFGLVTASKNLVLGYSYDCNLEKLQKRAACVIIDVKLDNVNTAPSQILFCQLHWIPLQDRINLHRVIETCKYASWQWTCRDMQYTVQLQ